MLVSGALALLAACGASGQSSSSDEDAPKADADWTTPAVYTTADGKATDATFTPPSADDLEKKPSVCVLFPHVKDPYWLAANEGTLLESKRLGIDYSAFQAGGYENLDKQLSQLDDCITQGYDAIAIGAISSDGVCDRISKALDKGIIVIDLINGIDCPDLEGNPKFAHSVVSNFNLGKVVAEQIASLPDAASKKIGLFPGPDGAKFVADFEAGFKEGIGNSGAQIVLTRNGDLGEDVQLGLIDDALLAYPEMNVVVGTSVAAQAGVTAVKNAGLDDVDVYGIAIISPNYDAIMSGDLAGGSTDFPSVLGRIAIDEAAMLFNGQDLPAPTIGTVPYFVDKDSADDVEYTDMIASHDFTATYSWSPQ